MSNRIADQVERETAIKPSQSFIVQAPAGSGKTELLTQRFLQLLSYTEKNPEEIIAITFTRKAAAEMRQRVIDALINANSEPEPKEPHKKTTWKLAKSALERNQQLDWDLLKNPNRIRILTIDALSAYLVQQIPIASKLSPGLNIVDHPSTYYKEAAQTLVYRLSDDPPWKPAIERLLLHLDNRVYLLENLLIDILSRREQWLPHITGQQKQSKQLRQHMEEALKNVVRESLQQAKALLSNDVLAELIPLASSAGRYCLENDSESPIAYCNDLLELSESIEDLPAWLGIAQLLLTQKGEWRKSITKRQGFPAKCELKPQMLSFLETLSEEEALRSTLHNILLAPPLTYSEQQWNIIQALLDVLPMLAAQLNVIFSRENVTDFVELNLAALRALGDSENPTDLAMHLDYRINHLLIDEFQDTSVIQFQLIEKLIDAWQPTDGRTIFLVGDPMQSIYRFRNAEVSLFLRAQQQGIAHIPLQSLTLKQNFRSQKNIVEWNNNNFDAIFPKETDISIGATPYSPAKATHTTDGQTQWHPVLNDDGEAEAMNVIKVIREHLKNTPEDHTAILVRSRNHLRHIIKQLHQENIDFQAIELEPLAALSEIIDIHSLTRAILHPADRIAWLAILRAPFCGLTLNDLYVIAQRAIDTTLWSVLQNYESIDELSNDAKIRLKHCIPALNNATANRGRTPFSQMLRTLWIDLKAPETMTHENQQTNIASYFNLLEAIETQPKPLSLPMINERLNTLYAEPNAPIATRLQVMTIHKAKGLEFDHVLLPGLHRKSPNDSHQILKWLERPNHLHQSDLILAPIKAIDQKQDAIYFYLKRVEKAKADLERARLLYVATTRAKKSLHLFANVVSHDDELKEPIKGSFLQLLWDQAKLHFQQATEPLVNTSEREWQAPTLRRLTTQYIESRPTPTFNKVHFSQPAHIALDNSVARHLGTLIHEALERLAVTGKVEPERWPTRLKQMGISAQNINHCMEQINHAITRTQQDPRGQWILSNRHQESRCELALTFYDKEGLKNIIIDRTFIDDEGLRWIIDYKTGEPSEEALLAYRQQLETYAKAMQLSEERPIKLALYFPLSSHWLEWEFACVTAIA